ncbi:unnamed protein product [Lymnaea stagnalis]|uniref:Uncharacterized protein n=1 Tax=Lymnaea stagnalis TaxID=6523 RepID=A0AAV2H1Q6_LYMST
MPKSQNTNAGQCEVSSTYKEYITSNLDSLRAKCSNLTECLDKLLTEESSFVVLQGENISLNKTCGLIYKPEGGNYTTLRGKCQIEDREEINRDIEHHVADQILSNRDWKNVKRCLENNYSDQESPRVEQLCKLAYRRKQICNNTGPLVHKRVEDFFNEQIKIMRCSCKSLATDTTSDAGGDESEISTGVWIGSGVGILIFLIIVFSLLFLCYRRKHKKSLKKRGPNVIYMPAPNSDTPVYQEIFDARGYCPSPANNPPSLPNRYISSPTYGQQDDPTYLEPVTAGMKYRPKPPVPGQASNPGYGSPPRYSECEKDSPTAEDIDNGYFNPLPSPNKDAGVPKAENNGYETIEASRLSIPLEDAPKPEDIPLGPVPARRTKKDDRQVESNYFVLEKDGVGNEGRNTA